MEMGDGEMEEGDRKPSRWKVKRSTARLTAKRAKPPSLTPDGAVNPEKSAYNVYTAKFDEIIDAEDLCDAEEWRVCGPISTSNYTRCRALFRALPTACNAACRPSRTGHGISI